MLELGAVPDDARMLLLRAGQEAGHVDEGEDRDAEGVTEAHLVRARAGARAGARVDASPNPNQASQGRTKRAALTEASMSRQPASSRGLLATTPTVRPSIRPKPVTIFLA